MNLNGMWIPSQRQGETSCFALWGEQETITDVDGNALPRFSSADDVWEKIKQIQSLPDHSNLHSTTRRLLLPSNTGVALEMELVIVRPAIGSIGDLLALLLQFDRDGIAIGSSLHYWSKVAKFILELLVSQHYVPFYESLSMDDVDDVDNVDNVDDAQEINGKVSTNFAEPSLVGKWDPLLDDTSIRYKINELINLSSTIDNNTVMNRISGAIGVEIINHEDMSRLTIHCIKTIMDLFIRETIEEPQIIRMMKSINPKYIAPLKPSEHWVHSLFVTSIEKGVPSLEWVEDDLKAWRQDIVAVLGQNSFRTCFRLEEPVVNENASMATEAGPSWRLGIYLQSNEDSSLLVPAERVWMETTDQLQYMNFALDQPQERLLRDLGIAASFFAPLGLCLTEAFPTECELDTNEAYQFLSQGAALLEKQGYGIYIPAWWHRTDSQIGLTMRINRNNIRREFQPNPRWSSNRLGFDQLLDFQWEIALGDATLTREQFEQLASFKLPLIQFRGRWVEFIPTQVDHILQLLERKGTITAANAIQLALNATKHMDEDDIVADLGLPAALREVTADGVLGKLLERINKQSVVAILDQPETLRGTLRPYQIEGFSWLVSMRDIGMGACLADDMGLGKTVQWIAYMLYLQQSKFLRGPALLICPTSVLGNWQRELERFAPALHITLHYGVDRLTGRSWREQAKQAHIVLTSYATAQRDEAELAEIEWDVITLDEAQNIKNIAAKQTQVIRRLKGFHRIALTGTPVENRLAELWSIMDFLNPDYLGSQDQFAERFAVPIEKNQDEDRTHLLQRIVQPFVMRRVKSDRRVIQDLPEKQEMKVYCSLTREQVTLYEAYVQEAFRKMERARGMERRGIILATLTHLKQICNHPAHFLREQALTEHRSGKLIRLMEMMEEIVDQGERILVFTQYATMAELLKSFVEKQWRQEVLLLHGRVPKKERDEMIVRFQEQDNAPRIFILSLKTGGYGLNLTRANHVFHFDRWWNPAVENQATDRAYRIGQEKNVQVHKFICAGTLEERIDQMMESKQSLAASVIGKGERWITEMSTDDLRSILLLRSNLLVNSDEPI